ncbi:MAG: four helix bundle suffix domain-containing protein [Patescibacteria group bacterium]
MGDKGYTYLLAYKLTVPIYDYTVVFCDRWVSKFSRTTDQMVQAARSGMQNIAEGYSQESLSGYIKLSGVSRGSFEELLNDYLSFARQRKLALWPKERVIREIGELGEIWEIIRKTKTLPDIPDFPNLPENPEQAVNMMITLIHQANYMISKLIVSLEEKHKREGGFSEKLLKRRLEYKKGRYGN